MSEISFISYWETFMEWFAQIPLLGQIFIIVGACAILILAIILVYYVLKGVAYLIYYILKGIYYLLKGIAIGIYKLFELLYYAISDKERPKKQDNTDEVKQIPVIEEKEPKTIVPHSPSVISFCSECGMEFSESMTAQLNAKGQVFCIHCGNGISNDAIDIQG
ncbi:MAG: hypothetical protein ACFFBP_11655 [Promethearchaeota archaeon]